MLGRMSLPAARCARRTRVPGQTRSKASGCSRSCRSDPARLAERVRTAAAAAALRAGDPAHSPSAVHPAAAGCAMITGGGAASGATHHRPTLHRLSMRLLDGLRLNGHGLRLHRRHDDGVCGTGWIAGATARTTGATCAVASCGSNYARSRSGRRLGAHRRFDRPRRGISAALVVGCLHRLAPAALVRRCATIERNSVTVRSTCRWCKAHAWRLGACRTVHGGHARLQQGVEKARLKPAISSAAT